MNNYDNKISLANLVGAGVRMLPHMKRLISSNAALSKVSGDDELSTGRIFEQVAERQPLATFLIFEGKSWNYGEFNAWVNRLAHLFKLNGVGNGDCVGLMMENRPELIACVLAVNKLGAVAGMLNHNQRDEVLRHSIGIINPRLFVIGGECIDAFDSQRSSLAPLTKVFWQGESSCPIGYADLNSDSANLPGVNLAETQRVKLRQKCYYIFTSGTTGLPKAASMTHLRWYKSGVGMGRAAMRLNRTDVMYCPLPLYHNNALTVAFSSVVNCGATMALARRFSATRFWDEIRSAGATSFIYVGELCRYLLNAHPKANDRDNRVRVVIGNGMRPEIWDEFQHRFGVAHVCEFYGASESSLGFVNIFNFKRTAGFTNSAFAIVKFDPDSETAIKGKDSYLQRVNRGDVGLLLSEVSEKTPFDGYTDKKATEAKLLRSVFEAGDCWFNTGDLVRDMGFGHIAFVDRVGDTFRWKGENVATSEVEGVIQNFPGVTEAVVYGVSVPKSDGKAGMVALTPVAEDTFDLRGFYSWLRKKLPAYAIPLFIRMQPAPETTATFKIKKTDLKRMGFNFSDSSDRLYVLRDREVGYEELSPKILREIESGDVRF